MNLPLPGPVHPSQITTVRQHEDVGGEPGDQLGRRIQVSRGPERGALRSQTLAAANLGCDESRFGGSEPARRSLLRLYASRTTADDIRLSGRLVLALVRPCQVEVFPGESANGG